MEPTGIEPVTFCLQSGRAVPRDRPDLHCWCAFVASSGGRRYGRIRRSQPSQVFTPPRLLGATARLLARPGCEPAG